MLLREGGHPDAVVAVGLHQPDQVLGVVQTLRVCVPLAQRVAARRVAAQRQHVADPGAGQPADHVPQLGDRVVDRGQVRHRQQGGVGGDPLGDLHDPVAVAAAGAVGDRDERRLQRLQLPDRLPELPLALVGLRREELEREGRAALGKPVANGGRHAGSLAAARGPAPSPPHPPSSPAGPAACHPVPSQRPPPVPPRVREPVGRHHHRRARRRARRRRPRVLRVRQPPQSATPRGSGRSGTSGDPARPAGPAGPAVRRSAPSPPRSVGAAGGVWQAAGRRRRRRARHCDRRRAGWVGRPRSPS